MGIELKPETERWLRQVEASRFASLEDAIEALVQEDRISESALESADLAWAKPYLDKGLADIEAGRTVPADQVHADLRARFARPRNP
jgi:antitoxin ParD1/3/4